MQKSQLLRSLIVMCALFCPIIKPGLANEANQETSLSQLKKFPAKLSTHAADLLAQDPKPTAVKITGVKLNPTDKGLEVMLDSESTSTTQPITHIEGNTLIADIENAVLALPEGPGFNVSNPAVGIQSVSVMQLNETTVQVRVRVIGTKAVPTASIRVKKAIATQPPSPTEPDEGEEEIVVTGDRSGSDYFVPNATSATKTDTPLRDIPASIQVIPKKVIQDQQVIRLEEALRNVSGVTFGGTGEGFGLFIDLRGFSGAPVLLDGFRQYGVVGSQGTSETANLEQIEILKGPASILYGEIQPGGVINLVSKKPLEKPFYSTELQVGNQTFLRPSFDLSGPLTSDGNLLYRLNGVYERSESFRGFETDNQRFFIAPVVTWKIDKQTDISFHLDYLDIKQPFDTGRLALGDRVADIPRDRIIGEPGDFTTNKTLNIGYNFEHRFNDNWKIRNAFQYLSRNILEDFAFPFDFDPITGLVSRNFGGFDIQVESFSLQTNVVGKFATGPVKHTLLFGVDLNKSIDTTFAAFDFLNPLPPFDIFNPVYGILPRPNFRETSTFVNYKITQDRLGLYLQDQMDLLNNLKLLLGFRYDTVKQNVKNGVTFFSPNPSEVNQTDSAFTPRVGIVYQPIKEVSLYASYSESFAPNTDSQFGGNILKPERGRGWEVGIKTELLKGKLFTTLAYFDITKRNVSTPDPNNPFLSIATGEQQSRGIELDINGQILPGWNVIAAYAYTDAEVTKDNLFPIGNRLSGVPRHNASLWTTYEIQKGDLKGLGVGVGFNYVGEREGNLSNTFKLDSYFLTNAAIFYKRNNYRFALNFKNIFNIDYSPGTPFDDNRIDVGESFTVIGSVSFEF